MKSNSYFKQELKSTKSVYYFISTSSRPAIVSFYDQLVKDKVIPENFPHDKPVHSGVFIYNHRTNKVEDIIEGSGSREGHLILYRNRASTIAKLENNDTLPGKDKNVNVYGNWKSAYQIKRYFLTDDSDLAKKQFDKFFNEFNDATKSQPIPYKPGSIDCQTCTHYLIKQITKKSYPSPHGAFTLGWLDGDKSPIELNRNITHEGLALPRDSRH